MSGKQGNDGAPGTTVAVPDHQLLRRIGDGSYGEVWLARSVTGALRAVKIVHRDGFSTDRPYDREFQGLLNFEPVSRGHDGLVDILQVGQRADGQSFYCVMELADSANDAGQAPAGDLPEWRAYQPLTLETLVRRRGGRLPVADCIAIAVKVADALQHLHAAGLVHRDIKPSNIIFVGGVPKLADVGLVARTDSTRTFVGTEGFVPPEGPGTPQADIYSFGKCLYEMATGKDRQEFPSPPADFSDKAEGAALLELNEVITRACDPAPAQRYQSAADLLRELEQLEGGKSVRQARRRRKAIRAGIWISGVSLLVAAAALFFQPTPRLQLLSEFALTSGQTASPLGIADHVADRLITLLITTGDGQLLLCAPNGAAHPKERIEGTRVTDVFASVLADTEGDGRKDYFISWREGRDLSIGCFNGQLMEKKPLRAKATGTLYLENGIERVESWFAARDFRPATKDSPPQLLTALVTGFPKWPREFRCYNATNMNLLWSLPFAAPPSHLPMLHDPGLGGGIVWLIGCCACSNGAELPDGENDGESCLRALDGDGRQLWRLPTGGEFSDCRPCVVPLREGNALYYQVRRDMEVVWQIDNRLPPLGRVFRASAEGKTLASYDLGTDLSSLEACDLDADGMPELLATDATGLLHVLDSDLRHLRAVRVAPAPPTTNHFVKLALSRPADLDGDGRVEIAVLSCLAEFVSGRDYRHIEGQNHRRYHDTTLTVYDTRFRRKAAYLVDKENSSGNYTLVTTAPDREGARQLVVLGPKVQFFQYGAGKMWE